jgi:hypothetical protein
MFLSELFDRSSLEADNRAGDSDGLGTDNSARGRFYEARSGEGGGGVYVEESYPPIGVPAWETHLRWVKREWINGEWHWEYRWPLEGVVPAFRVFDGGGDGMETDERGMLELSSAVSLTVL